MHSTVLKNPLIAKRNVPNPAIDAMLGILDTAADGEAEAGGEAEADRDNRNNDVGILPILRDTTLCVNGTRWVNCLQARL